MIDMHLHALPGVDDGARTPEESIHMLQTARDQGFTAVILTPHFHFHRHSPNKGQAELRNLVEQLQNELQKTCPGFSLHLGQEIKYVTDLTEHIKSGDAWTLADSRYVLVEFDPGDSWNTIYQAVRKLLMNRYSPIVAHIERYEALRKPGRLEELKTLGAELQMNYSSLEGGIFNGNTRWCRQQVLEGRIDYLGTDAHREAGDRSPDVSKALKWLRQKCPEALVRRITEENPGKLLNTEQMQASG